MNHVASLFEIHAQTVQRLRFRKSFVAAHTTEAAHNAVFILKLGEVFRLTITAMTRHFWLDFLSA
jgi:hypothetical protein